MRHIRLRSAAATLTVSNVGATARWYRENLGFASSMFPQQAPILYASLRRDRAEIVLIADELSISISGTLLVFSG